MSDPPGTRIWGGGPGVARLAGTAFSFCQFRRHGASRVTASWALAVSGLISSFTFALVLAGGAAASGSRAAAAVGLAGAALSLAPTAAILLVLRCRGPCHLISRVAALAVCQLNRLARRVTFVSYGRDVVP